MASMRNFPPVLVPGFSAAADVRRGVSRVGPGAGTDRVRVPNGRIFESPLRVIAKSPKQTRRSGRVVMGGFGTSEERGGEMQNGEDGGAKPPLREVHPRFKTIQGLRTELSR